MPKFNQKLWEVGRQIEDDALPKLNKYFDCDLKRDEENVWEILDFRDENTKTIVEVKGRRTPSTKYEDTIVTASKVMAGQMEVDKGYKVYFLFVFTDCSKIMELKSDSEFKCKFTGSNCIRHYLIPVAGLTDFDPDDDEFVAIEPELESEEDMIEIN